jgi:hypothetical protein
MPLEGLGGDEDGVVVACVRGELLTLIAALPMRLREPPARGWNMGDKGTSRGWASEEER